MNQDYSKKKAKISEVKIDAIDDLLQDKKDSQSKEDSGSLGA